MLALVLFISKGAISKGQGPKAQLLFRIVFLLTLQSQVGLVVFFFQLLTEAIEKLMFASSYHRYSLLLIKPLSYCGLFVFYSQVEIRFFTQGEK